MTVISWKNVTHLKKIEIIIVCDNVILLSKLHLNANVEREKL